MPARSSGLSVVVDRCYQDPLVLIAEEKRNVDLTLSLAALLFHTHAELKDDGSNSTDPVRGTGGSLSRRPCVGFLVGKEGLLRT